MNKQLDNSQIDLDFSFEVESSKSDTESIVIKGWANKSMADNGVGIVDRDGDVVLPTAYNMENFLKNPIILYQHDRGQPIGKMLNFEISQKGLEITAEIFKDMNNAAYVGVKNGVLRTFSVGFRGHDGHYDGDNDIFYFTDVELLEVSVVSVPANQDSVFSVMNSDCEGGACTLAAKGLGTKQDEVNSNPAQAVLDAIKELSDKIDNLELVKEDEPTPEPVAEEPAPVEEPTVEEPVVEDSAPVDEPVVEEPAADETVAEEPAPTAEATLEGLIAGISNVEVTDDTFEPLVALVEELAGKLDAKIAEVLR